MPSPLSPIRPLAGPELGLAKAPAAAGAPGEFQKMFANAVGTVESLRSGAGQAVGRFLSGEGEEVHSLVLATQRAELAFEMFMQVRNKVVQAYQEIMRMQI